MGGSTGGDMEKFDNYCPRGEAKPKLTPRKTPSKTPTGGQKRSYEHSLSGSPAKKTAAVVKRERTASKSSPTKKEPKIIIGIDFGTTFSGLAYAYSGGEVDKNRNVDVDVVMSWDDSNQDEEKVPSAIDFSNLVSCTWGNDAKGGPGAIEWFKLLLINDSDLPVEVRESEYVQKARNRLQELDMDAEDVIATYLQNLWTHCIQKIKNGIGEYTVDYSRLHLVMTLPAIWPNYAREKMRQAIAQTDILDKRKGVGQPTLTFISEPEAAALATLSGIDGRHDVQTKDSFVVVDCGGGTVDIISYRVSGTEPMVVKEIVKGQGALCGAVFVESRFRDLLKRKLVAEVSKDALDLVEQEEIDDIMFSKYEHGIRTQFSGEVQKWPIRVPPSLRSAEVKKRLGSNPTFEITSSDMEEVFEPTVTKIESLVKTQLDAVLEKEDKLPKYVILVGGFGRSRYLFEYLKQRCGGVEVLQTVGAKPWTAICRGAVIHGLTIEKLAPQFSVQVRSRIARASYGIVCQEKWDALTHSEEDQLEDPERRVLIAKNQMKWLVEKGHDVTAQQTFKHDFFRLFDEQPKTLSTQIWMSKAKSPPSRRNGKVTKFCEVAWNAKIDFDALPLFINNQGKEYRRLDYTAEMKCGGGSTELFIRHNGKRQAQQNVQVDFQDCGGI